MKLTVAAALFCVALSSATPFEVVERAPCNPNNCLRQVRGTRLIKGTPRDGAGDCSSYLASTVTPATISTTLTASTSTTTDIATVLTTTTLTVGFGTFTTVTTTVPAISTSFLLGAPPGKRDLDRRQQAISPTQIPAYASSCENDLAYRSACSCLGVFPTVITRPAPVSTLYAQASATTSTTVTVTPLTVTTSVVTSTTQLVSTATSIAGVEERHPCNAQNYHKYSLSPIDAMAKLVDEANTGSKDDCCRLCANYGQCIAYYWYPAIVYCRMIIGLNAYHPVLPGTEAYCPLGSHRISPNGFASPGGTEMEFGICAQQSYAYKE